MTKKEGRAIIKRWLKRYRIYKSRMKTLQGLAEHEKEYKTAVHIVSSIDNAMEAISEEKQRIVKEKFIKGKSWRRLSLETYYSERWLREICNRAVDKIALTIFIS